jgi:hypothetical protein
MEALCNKTIAFDDPSRLLASESIGKILGICVPPTATPKPAPGKFMKHAFGALMAIATAYVLLLPAVAQDYSSIVAASDRSDADRNTDKRRAPIKLLNFVGVKEGMKVLDMEAGAGYTTELLARAVGPTGIVYAQDSADVIERQVKDKFDLRAKSPVMRGVIHVVRNYDDPIPPDVSNLDLITFFSLIMT